jgi:hypothetical protein
MIITEHDFPPVDSPIWEYTAVGSTAVILLTCSSTKAPCPGSGSTAMIKKALEAMVVLRTCQRRV